MTPALIPAPRSQERGCSLLCNIPLVKLSVGLGNCPVILRQADSQTLCLPQAKVWEIYSCGGSLCRGWVLPPAFSEKPTQGQHRPHRERKLCDGKWQTVIFNRVVVLIDLRVLQRPKRIHIIPMLSATVVLPNGNQLSLFQFSNAILQGADGNTQVDTHSFEAGLAFTVTIHPAHQVRQNHKFKRIEPQLEHIVGHHVKVFRRLLPLFHSSTSELLSIHAMNLSLGTTIRLPILMWGNPAERTNSYAPALEIPSTSPTSGTESISGKSS